MQEVGDRPMLVLVPGVLGVLGVVALDPRGPVDLLLELQEP